MLDKDVYYVKKLKQQMLSIFNMVMKTEEMAMKETAESGELSALGDSHSGGRGTPRAQNHEHDRSGSADQRQYSLHRDQ